MNDTTTPTGDTPVDPAAAAATERRAAPVTAVETADLADRYAQMLRLADELDGVGEQMRAWAEAGVAILDDPDVADSAALSPATWARAEEELRAATTGRSGLLGRAADLDADAMVLRATVHTYRWIDDLQAAAYATLGAIAGRAIGYLAPEVALGGTIVAAGLIETDTLDRDGVAAYLGDLAEANPELMEHVTTGGGLVESLQMRALLTSGLPGGADGEAARRGGLRAAEVATMPADFSAALRDVAVGLAEDDTVGAIDPEHAAEEEPEGAPDGLGDLMARLAATADPVCLHWVSEQRAIAYLPGPDPRPAGGPHLRLVSGDHSGYADDVLAFLEQACAKTEDVRLLLVGAGAGGAAAVEVARRADNGFRVEEVVTANAPAALVPPLPPGLPVLSLEDRTDPVALLGSLVNAGSPDRLTIVYDPTSGAGAVAGGRAADLAPHPELRTALERMRERGYLTA